MSLRGREGERERERERERDRQTDRQTETETERNTTRSVLEKQQPRATKKKLEQQPATAEKHHQHQHHHSHRHNLVQRTAQGHLRMNHTFKFLSHQLNPGEHQLNPGEHQLDPKFFNNNYGPDTGKYGSSQIQNVGTVFFISNRIFCTQVTTNSWFAPSVSVW